MGKTPDRIRTQGAVILAIDLHQYCDNKGWHWTVDVHRPGTDGLFSRTWHSPGRLPSSSVEDLTTYVQRTCLDALVTWGGVQEVQPAEA